MSSPCCWQKIIKAWIVASDSNREKKLKWKRAKKCYKFFNSARLERVNVDNNDGDWQTRHTKNLRVAEYVSWNLMKYEQRCSEAKFVNKKKRIRLASELDIRFYIMTFLHMYTHTYRVTTLISFANAKHDFNS